MIQSDGGGVFISHLQVQMYIYQTYYLYSHIGQLLPIIATIYPDS